MVAATYKSYRKSSGEQLHISRLHLYEQVTLAATQPSSQVAPNPIKSQEQHEQILFALLFPDYNYYSQITARSTLSVIDG